jgi:hypothetical protein
MAEPQKKWVPKYLPCPDPEGCDELHNECSEGCADGEHHYGCECRCCMHYYWTMKR